MRLRRLNEQGLQRFQDWLDDGALGAAPIDHLVNPATSSLVSSDIKIPSRLFSDRYQFL